MSAAGRFPVFFPQPAGSGLQPAPSGIPMIQRPGGGLHLTWSFLQPAEDAGGPGPEIQKGQERRQKTACGAALWTLSADAAGHFPLRAPAWLQRAEAAKDLRALGCRRHRWIRGVSMRATFCSLQCLRVLSEPCSQIITRRTFVGGRGALQLQARTRATRQREVSEGISVLVFES